MVKDLVKIISKVKPLKDVLGKDKLSKKIKHQILDGFNYYKRKIEQKYYAQITYSRIILLARIGEKTSAKNYANQFRREIGYEDLEY